MIDKISKTTNENLMHNNLGNNKSKNSNSIKDNENKTKSSNSFAEEFKAELDKL